MATESRRRLDHTLATGAFADKECVAELVKKQLLSSPLLHKTDAEIQDCIQNVNMDQVSEKKSAEIWEVLESFRSVHNAEEWKLKEETKFMRVMYRKARGTPFHSYCVDGVISGPIRHALCVLWEVPCFKDWWPHIAVPAFKVLESKWLQRLRVCENLCYLRLKVPWPLAMRELLVTSFELEHLEDEAILGSIKAIPPDTSLLKESASGLDSSSIPAAMKDVVRMEANGGFILQKITDDQTYFRAIVDLDLKLDFVPPWIINFIGRQVVGHGCRLYQKAVLSVEKSKVFQDAIKADPLYTGVAAGMSLKDGQEFSLNHTPEKVLNC